MRVVRSYTNVWKIEKVLYGINDFHLPRPVLMSNVIWAGFFFILSLLLKGFPPFLFTDSLLTNHIALPVALAWLMSRMRFDGKAPFGFVRSVLCYWMSPRMTVRGKEIRLCEIPYREIRITIGKRKGGERG